MDIRVDLKYPIKDGTEVVFRSPVDCSQVTGLKVCYIGEDGNAASQEFVLADAHGNNVGDIDHLFAENVAVKVILDVTNGMAFVQNADTNAYLEGRFAALQEQVDNNLFALLGWNGNSEGFWSEGCRIDGQTGEIVPGGCLVFTNGYVPRPVTRIRCLDRDFEFAVFVYNDNGEYLGVWNGSGYEKGDKTYFSELCLFDIDTDITFPSLKYRVEVRNIEGEEAIETELLQYHIIQFDTELSNDVRKVNNAVGDIETALDGIIAIQTELIGGDGV